MDNDAALTAPGHLTQQEAELVYNLEVLGLPLKKACEMAGVGIWLANKPHIVQAREQTKREIRGSTAITKEDVVFGVKDAIDRARIIAEPSTEIRGWEVISKLLGYDAPTKVDINLRESIHVVQQQVRGLSDGELVKLLGAGDVIDGEFYEDQ